MINILIVDDEQPAREELAWLLGQFDHTLVQAQLGSAHEAIAHLKAHADIDLVFLDIDMPGFDGLRLANLWTDQLGDDAPLIVFVTAYEEHALDAFDLHAVDYLLKPVRLARLEKTLHRVRQRLQNASASFDPGHLDPPTAPLERISVEELGHYRVLPVKDILWVEADEGFATVHTPEGSFLTDFSLRFLEENLPPDDFFRCHRSYIVRLDAITRIAPTGAGTYRLLVGDQTNEDQSVPLARSRAPELKARMPWSASAL